MKRFRLILCIVLSLLIVMLACGCGTAAPTKKAMTVTVDNTDYQLTALSLPVPDLTADDIDRDSHVPSGITYKTELIDEERQVLRKYDGDSIVWEYQIPANMGWCEFSVGEQYICLYSRYSVISDNLHLILLNPDGTVHARTVIAEERDSEDIQNVVFCEDRLVVFIYGFDFQGDRWLYIHEYDLNCALQQKLQYNTHLSAIRNGQPLGSGYIVYLDISYDEPTSLGRFMVFDQDCNPLSDFSYTLPDRELHIVDYLEAGGKLYISANATPLSPPGGTGYNQSHEETDTLLDIIHDRDNIHLDNDVTDLVQDNYEAVLLVCDSQTLEPIGSYTAMGCLDGTITVTAEGGINWDLCRPVSCYYSPGTSSFSIGGQSCILRYSFDRDGSYSQWIHTGEMVSFTK